MTIEISDGFLVKPLEIARSAAQRAGHILMEYYGKLDSVRKKSAVDLVTDADLASEKSIVSMIREAFPDHGILAEEGHYASIKSGSSPYWVIDPLDGTTNFVHNLPIFAVSIALVIEDVTRLGVVYNPASVEEFVAVKGAGSVLNDSPIHVSNTPSLSDALLVTGFPYTHDHIFHRSFDIFHELYNRCQGIRRLGAAAIDCCYVACGRFDAFYEAALKPWDICAGALICEEAGGQTSDWYGSDMPFDGSRVMLSNGTDLHAELLELFNQQRFTEIG